MTHISSADAQRAIYIDFECLKGPPPHPALLGVLIGSEGEELQQVITDERLAPARVAKRERTRVATTPEAVDTLVALAIAEDRRVVGWSYFDRDRLIEARPDLVDDINARYVNALHVARPWRAAIHPKVRIERAGPFDPKHTLDKYARLASYPQAASLGEATPAKWIRHTLDQLKSNSGRYRQMTHEAKRDWHKLLDYNRHDCLALRHIVLRAARELECWRAYTRTRFCVREDARTVCFMAGSTSPRLDALVRRHGADRWAFITAWNPASIRLRPEENAQRERELSTITAAAGLRVLPGEGVGEDPAWTPEKSLMILGIGPRAAVRLGRRFGQLAIVTGRLASTSRLVSCAPVLTLP